MVRLDLVEPTGLDWIGLWAPTYTHQWVEPSQIRKDGTHWVAKNIEKNVP
jgi:hypothetical protein